MIIFVQKSALIYAAKRMADEHKTIYAIKDENAFESALKRAENRGLATADGLGMLLHQARPAFQAWFGVMPEITAELRELVLQ